MAFFKQNVPSNYNNQIRKLEASDRVQDTTFNAIFQELIYNESFLKEQISVQGAVIEQNKNDLNDSINITNEKVQQNADNISSLTQTVESNQNETNSALETIRKEMTVNANNISVNSDNISAVAERTTKNESDISNNANAISSNTDLINSNQQANETRFTNVEKNVSDNSSLIENNTKSISTNATNIELNAKDIQTCLSAISNNSEEIDKNFSSIAELEKNKADRTEIPDSLPASDVSDWAKQTVPDTTLAVSGQASDSKTVGDKITELRNLLDKIKTTVDVLETNLSDLAERVFNNEAAIVELRADIESGSGSVTPPDEQPDECPSDTTACTANESNPCAADSVDTCPSDTCDGCADCADSCDTSCDCDTMPCTDSCDGCADSV